MEPKTDFQGLAIESSVLHPVHGKHSPVLWIPQSSCIWPLLRWAIARTALPQRSLFLYLFILISYSCWSSGHLPLPLAVTVRVIYTRASFSSVFPVSPAHVPVHGAVLTASVFHLWYCERGAGGELVVIKSPVVFSNVPGLHIHSSLTSLTHPEQLPVLQAPFMVMPYTGVPFFIFYTIFLPYLFYV